MSDKIHLLHKANPSRLGKVTVLANAEKPTQRVKQNEDAEEYVPKERTR